MKFNEFTETVRDGLAVLFEPDNMEVAVTRVVKNNGLILTGINIRDRNSMITPTIYIDDFYREDIQKEEIHTVVLRIKDIFTERCTKVSSDNEIQNYMDFNWVKNRLIYTVVNQSMNEEYLEHVPYIPFHYSKIMKRNIRNMLQIFFIHTLIHNRIDQPVLHPVKIHIVLNFIVG